MSRFLIIVPRLYTKNEFKKKINEIPEDYDEKACEFWNYVNEKLDPFVKQINKVYYELIDKGGEAGLKDIKANFDENSYAIVEKLIENGAQLQATEDPLLVMETYSWIKILEDHPDLAGSLLELYRESMEIRDSYIANIIGRTLGEGEKGIIFIEPSHKINLQENVKIIKMCRFDPIDYLNIWVQKLKLKGKLST